MAMLTNLLLYPIGHSDHNTMAFRVTRNWTPSPTPQPTTSRGSWSDSWLC